MFMRGRRQKHSPVPVPSRNAFVPGGRAVTKNGVPGMADAVTVFAILELPMKRACRRTFLANLLGATAAVRAASASPALLAQSGPQEAPTQGGFVPLFNGRDLAGWVNVNCAPGTFTVREGVIVSTGIPTGVLRTDRHYENFILELEWKHVRPGGNAGLFVHSEPITAPGVPFAKAIEVQILDGGSPSGIATGHGDVFSIHGAEMIPDRPHPRGWQRCLPSEKRARPAGEWNHYRVESRDGRLTLAVNGKVVSGASQCRPRRGYLCLESEGSECHFRNLRLQELPSSNPPPSEVAGLDQGFQSLHNGIDLSGWATSTEHAGHWTAKDWILDCDGKGASRIWTRSQWEDFEWIADWRMETAQAGAALLVRGPNAGEVELKATGKEWSRTVVRLQHGRLEVMLNGQVVIADRDGSKWPSQGPLGLRHSGTPVRFANLYVRALR